MALRKDGAARPSVTVATPSRMKSRRDTRNGRSLLDELVFGRAHEEACEARGPGVELCLAAGPAPPATR